MRRADFVELARGWIDTPWHHQASRKGVGSDCVGLVLGVMREAGLTTPSLPPWRRYPQGDEMLRVLDSLAARVTHQQPGDLLVFRVVIDPQHVGIMSAPGWMVHAHWGRRVAETTWYPDLLVASYHIPGVTD